MQSPLNYHNQTAAQLVSRGSTHTLLRMGRAELARQAQQGSCTRRSSRTGPSSGKYKRAPASTHAGGSRQSVSQAGRPTDRQADRQAPASAAEIDPQAPTAGPAAPCRPLHPATAHQPGGLHAHVQWQPAGGRGKSFEAELAGGDEAELGLTHKPQWGDAHFGTTGLCSLPTAYRGLPTRLHAEKGMPTGDQTEADPSPHTCCGREGDGGASWRPPHQHI